MKYIVKERAENSVEPELLKALLGYIEWHEGVKARPKFINFVCDPEGDSVALVRYTSSDGLHWSAFLDFYHMFSDAGKIKWDVTERCVFPRKDENDYVLSIESLGGFGDDCTDD